MNPRVSDLDIAGLLREVAECGGFVLLNTDLRLTIYRHWLVRYDLQKAVYLNRNEIREFLWVHTPR